jgi:tetratricopeptide (TPR) repeat protein
LKTDCCNANFDGFHILDKENNFMSLTRWTEKYYKRAKDCYKKGKYEAVIIFCSALKEDYNLRKIKIPQMFHQLCAKAYIELGNYVDAIPDLEALSRFVLVDYWVYRCLAQAYFDSKNFNHAIFNINEAIKLKFLTCDFSLRGMCHFKINNFDAALADYSKAIDLAPHDPVPYYHRSLTYMRNGRYHEAMQDIEFAVSLHSEVAYYELKGVLHFYLEQDIEAYWVYTQAITLIHEDSAALSKLYSSRALASFVLGSIAHAQEDADKARKHDHENDLAYLVLGYCAMHRSEFSEAVSVYTSAILCKFNDGFSYFKRGEAYFALGKLHEAIRDYSEAILRDNTKGEYYAKRGDCYYQQAKYSLAITDFDKAIGLNSECSLYYSRRAKAYKKTGQDELARLDKDNKNLFRRITLFSQEGRICARLSTNSEEVKFSRRKLGILGR